MKIVLIYDTTTGNNKNIAHLLSENLKNEGDISISYAKEIDPEELISQETDWILLGGPVRAMMLSRTIKLCANKIIKTAKKSDSAKKIGFWGTHASNLDISKKWAPFIKKSTSAVKIYPNVLDLKVLDVAGPLEDDADAKIKFFAESFVEFTKRE